MRKGLILILVLSLVLSGCGLVKTSQSPTASTTPATPSPTPSIVPTSSPKASWTGLNITWTKIEQGNFPPNRNDYFLSYDSKRDRLLFFGGETIEAGIPLKDLWAFDFSTNLWELLSKGRELPPPPLYPPRHREIVYDPLKDRLLLFQCGPSEQAQPATGNQPPPPLSEGDSYIQPGYEVQVYAFNFEENCWGWLDPPLKPPDRLEWFQVVWDGKNDRVFLFGGEQIIQGPGSSEVQEVQAKDLWVFDCQKDLWRELTSNMTLPGRFPIDLGPSSYDPQTDRLLILKPREENKDLLDVSALQLPGTSWSDLKSSDPPIVRGTRYVAYDPLFHVLILPGGAESETGGDFKPKISIYYPEINCWTHWAYLPGNDQRHLIVPGKPGEAFILTDNFEDPSHHNLWRLTLGP